MRRIPSTTPWRQDYAVMGVHAAARWPRRSGLRISLMSSGGWLPAAKAAGRAAALDDSKRAIDQALEIGAEALLIVPGRLPPGSIDVEIFVAETWWKRDPDEVLAIVRDRFEFCV